MSKIEIKTGGGSISGSQFGDKNQYTAGAAGQPAGSEDLAALLVKLREEVDLLGETLTGDQREDVAQDHANLVDAATAETPDQGRIARFAGRLQESLEGLGAAAPALGIVQLIIEAVRG
ncbi:hypothetical protein ACWEF9_05595 [Streptomyces sp. NPDC004980]